jgi:hypothetical protein
MAKWLMLADDYRGADLRPDGQRILTVVQPVVAEIPARR